jgi:hypothetical protein
VLLGACSGGTTTASTTTTTTAPRPAAGPADIAAMRALLERYSPSGHTIVTTYERLPRRFVIGTSTITVGFGGDFGKYFDDGAPENLVDSMDTAVHEVYHGWSSVMGYQLLVETGTPLGAGAEGLYVGKEPMLVLHGATFPANEMESSFPADARTYRYSSTSILRSRRRARSRTGSSGCSTSGPPTTTADGRWSISGPGCATSRR